MLKSWYKEIGLFLCLIIGSILLGLILQALLPTILIILTAYIIYQFYQLYHFTCWIEKKHFSSLPETGGVWGELYYGVFKLNELSKKHKRHMGRILNQYRKTTETLPDATIIIDNKDNVVWVNKAAKKFFHLMKSDYGRRIDNILRTPELTHYLHQKDYSQSLRFQYRGDYHYTFLLSLLPYQDKQCLLIARDITQLAQLEARQYDLITNTSHELKTPLTVIRGYVDGLLEGEISAPKKKALQHIDQQVLRLLNTINDFLTICQLSEHRPKGIKKTIDIPILLHTLQQQAQTMYGTFSHSITLSITTTLNIIGNPSEIKSAFENLISNAVQYTPKNGCIALSWTERPDQSLCFEVKDNGIGIPNEAIQHITERFYRAANHQNKHGSGLGLSIVQKIMEKHQSKLIIESQLGQGSTFKCVFPHIPVRLQEA